MATLRADGKATFTVDGEEVVLEMDDVLVDTAEKDGFVSSGDNNLTVVLDGNLTPELVEEGFVREIVSKVQTMRKEADFNVTDRIQMCIRDRPNRVGGVPSSKWLICSKEKAIFPKYRTKKNHKKNF